LGNKIPPYQGGTKIVGIRASGFRTRDLQGWIFLSRCPKPDSRGRASVGSHIK
jgi:hypothetical protein